MDVCHYQSFPNIEKADVLISFFVENNDTFNIQYNGLWWPDS